VNAVVIIGDVNGTGSGSGNGVRDVKAVSHPAELIVFCALRSDDCCIDTCSLAECFYTRHRRVCCVRNIKAKLVPSDDITVFYKTVGNLARIIPSYYDFIFSTIKQPMRPFAGSPPSGSAIHFIVSDNAKVISSSLGCCLFRLFLIYSA